MSIHRNPWKFSWEFVPEPDSRGLMPLERARSLVKGLKQFDRGEGHEVDDSYFWDSDLRWAALCSLENVEEFLETVRGVEWLMPPRGLESNVEFYDRYGDGILPWIDEVIAEDGKTSCAWAKTCLLEIGGDGAAAVALRLGTAGFQSWLERHADSAAWVAAQAEAGDPRALEVMKLLKRPEELPPTVKAVLGEVEPLDIPQSRAVTRRRVDELLAQYELPRWDNMNVFFGGMCITGFVTPDDRDMLVIQALQIGPGDSDLWRELYRIAPDKGGSFGNLRKLVSEDLTEGLEVGQPIELPELGITAVARIDLSGLEGELLAHFEQPMDAGKELLVRLGQEFPSHVYLEDDQLREAVDLPPSAVALFRFSAFDMPTDKVEDSLDFLAMILALRDRRPIRRLPQNVHPLQGLTTADV